MADELAGGAAGVAEAEAVDDVVETQLKELEQDFAGDAAAVGGFLEGLAELPLKQAVLELELLLLAEHHGVVGLLAAGAAGAMLAGAVGAALHGLAGAEEGDPESAADLLGGSGVTCHVGKSWV